MRNKKFTLLVLLMIFLSVGAASRLCAQAGGTGTGWGELGFSEQIVLAEDFSGFSRFGNWAHENDSNSKDLIDEITGDVKPGNMSGTKTISFLGSNTTLTYTWDSCAFAPDWGVAASVDKDGIPIDPNPTTTGVSNGFVEIARAGYGTLPGEFIIDLSNMDYIEGIQYSHSSCGGKKRGFMLTMSLDAGETWDTLRYQPGNPDISFTKDPFDWSKTANEFTCEPSASGMLWEDAIYVTNDDETKVWLKFEATNTVAAQAVRIHDFKVYGTVPSSVSGIGEKADGFNVKVHHNNLNISEKANVSVFSISGKLIKSADAVKILSLEGLSNGVYIVKAQNGSRIATTKFVKR